MLVTAMLIGPVVWPCATVALPPERFVFSEKLMVVAATVRPTAVDADVPPEVP